MKTGKKRRVYTDKEIKMLKKATSTGSTRSYICKRLNISISTFEKDPVLKKAYQGARAKAIQKGFNAFFHRVENGEKWALELFLGRAGLLEYKRDLRPKIDFTDCNDLHEQLNLIDKVLSEQNLDISDWEKINRVLLDRYSVLEFAERLKKVESVQDVNYNGLMQVEEKLDSNTKCLANTATEVTATELKIKKLEDRLNKLTH